jgi:hypothetical protein
LAVVDSYGAAENCERLGDFYRAGCYGVDGASGGGALINAGVKFAGGFAVVEALYAEGGEDAAGDGSGERIFPEFYVGDGGAKFGERLDVLGGGVEGFDLRG